MLITLFTDASYCSRSRVAAYAAWAKADGRTVRHSGVLKQPVPDSSLAESGDRGSTGPTDLNKARLPP
jgi:hypothetical protein